MNLEEYENQICSQKYESIVQLDPTLRFLLRESKFDIDKLEHQVSLRIAAAKIAIGKYINYLSNIN